MITLITGVPGSGKTLSVVSDLAKKVKKEWADRKIFTFGIPELTIPVEPVPAGHSLQDLHVWLQKPEYYGSVVIIDEAQNIFPPRSSGTKTPEIVEWLHVHRHSGIDLILITQMPGRIDKQVRDLVGGHYHIHKTPLGVRMRYFWDYCANSPKSDMKNARPEVYKFDKSAFNLYRSAEVHTKIKTPKSRILWVLPLFLILFVFFAFVGYKKLSGFTEPAPAPAASAAPVDVKKTVETGANDFTKQNAGSLAQQQQRSLTPEMFQPTIEGKAESKPLYDSVRVVRDFEYPAACVSGGRSGCSCYSSQGTVIKEIDKKTCRDYAENGLPFNPYKQRRIETAAKETIQPAESMPVSLSSAN